MTLNEWHTVRMTRTGRHGTLKVDGGPQIEGRSQGSFTQLTLSLDLFVGGHRNYDETAKSAGVDRSFSGCIQQVRSVDCTLLIYYKLKRLKSRLLSAAIQPSAISVYYVMPLPNVIKSLCALGMDINVRFATDIQRPIPDSKLAGTSTSKQLIVADKKS